MLWTKIRDMFENREEGGRKVVIWIIIAAIVILALSGVFNQNLKAEKDKKAIEITYSHDTVKQMEADLKAVVEKISGAGETEVLINVDYYSEKVLAKDMKSKSDIEEKGSTYENEEKNLLIGQGASEQPFVVKEKTPVPSGVIIVAQGATNEKVKYEICDAVKALYGIPMHRIKVTALKK